MADEISNDCFMEEVQKYDYLYNRNSRDYKDKYKKLNAWSEVGEKFDMTPREADKKFKNIRNAYGRYLKKVKSIPSGSGRDADPTPREFASLGWLDKHICHRPTAGNFDLERCETNTNSNERITNSNESNTNSNETNTNSNETITNSNETNTNSSEENTSYYELDGDISVIIGDEGEATDLTAQVDVDTTSPSSCASK